VRPGAGIFYKVEGKKFARPPHEPSGFGEDFNIRVFQRLQGHPPIAMMCPKSAAGILPAGLTSPECGAMPVVFCTFRIADRIIIQFDLPARCRKHFVARPHPDLLPMIDTIQEKGRRFTISTYSKRR
jgi:hypothetical protein